MSEYIYKALWRSTIKTILVKLLKYFEDLPAIYTCAATINDMVSIDMVSISGVTIVIEKLESLYEIYK